jgi:hypothetical protein
MRLVLAGAVAASAAAVAAASADASKLTLHGVRHHDDPHPSGAGVAISQDGLNFACQQVLEPLLEKELNALTFPDIDTEEAGIKVHLDNLRTHDFKCAGCVKATLAPGSGLQVQLHGFEIMLHSRYVLHKIVSTGGECETKLKDADLSTLVTFGVSADGHPTLSATDEAASVGNLDLGCSGVSGSLLDALSDVFKGAVIKAVTDAAKSALSPAIAQVSQSLGKTNLDVAISGGFSEVRFDFAAAPTVAAGWISAQTFGACILSTLSTCAAPCRSSGLFFHSLARL